MSTKIPTWEKAESSGEFDDYGDMYRYLCGLHVKAALLAGAEKSMITAESEEGKIITRKEFELDDRRMKTPYTLYVNKESILNAYPLKNIK